MTDIIDRRKAITAIAVAPAVAALPLAAPPAQANDGENARDLWRRYIEANVAHNAASNEEDDADVSARNEISELECPWTPDPSAEWKTVQTLYTDNHTLLEMVKVDTPKLEDGSWLVREFRPKARIAYVDLKYSDRPKPFSTNTTDADWRWLAYPDTNSPGKALDASKARAIKEWRSWRGRCAAIVRKHRVRPLEAGRKHIWDSQLIIAAREIVTAPCDGPTILAVKLALSITSDITFEELYTLDHTLDDDAGIQECEEQAIVSIYRHAVQAGGYDPCAEWRNTAGV